MGMLIWALIAFVGTHFLMSHPLRAPMVKALGDKGFQIVYSLVSFATLFWAIKAFQAIPRGTIDTWRVGDGFWALATILMLFGSILFIGSLFGNPALTPAATNAAASAPAKGVFAITRHPMMWGFALWGAVHMLVAPYQANLYFTAAFIILALVGAWGQDIKKARLAPDAWSNWKARTSYFPFARQITGKSSWGSAWPGVRTFTLGVILWLGASYLHPQFGAPVAGIFRWLWA